MMMIVSPRSHVDDDDDVDDDDRVAKVTCC